MTETHTQIPDPVWQAALAGLLHDIGKFSQRAGRGKSETWDEEAREQIRYEHALASYSFVQQYVPAVWRPALGGVAYHHQPRTLTERWVELADWMSSAERVKEEDLKTPYLQSILTRVNEYGQPHLWPLGRLDVTSEKALFPRPLQEREWRGAYQDEYARLWDAFEQECESRGIKDSSLSPEAYLETLLALLQEFAWAVPSAYWKSVPDVSLYDHLRTTAALAACLAADKRDETWCQAVETDLRAERPSREAALLIGGDFSGIQDFIYTLASSGAAKSLRARSFYLQVLGEVVALNVLGRLGLPLTNLVYVGGGGFYLLAPVNAAQVCPALAADLTDRLMETHQGRLGLALAWETVRAHEFVRFNLVYDRLRAALNVRKRQPFAQASSAVLAQQIGQPLTQGGDPLRFCSVTGEDRDLEERNGELKTRFVWSLEELGRDLPRATHLILTRAGAAPAGRPHTWVEALAQFGYTARLVRQHETEVKSTSGDLTRIWRLDPRNPGREKEWLKPDLGVLSYRPMAKLAPVGKDGQVLTFDELAEEKAVGFKRWGILRMDVDNLGRLFREGLGKQASLSRVASLSFALRLFFEGWLPELAGEDLKDRIYIQYSGGDDLLVVGAWDALPEFAMRVRESFHQFAGGNPAFTLSGGIAVVESKFPLYQAARQAGEAEEAAKSFRTEKDAITFLGQTMAWDKFKQALHDSTKLAEWIRLGQAPRSLLQVILGLRQQVVEARQEAQRNGKPKPAYGRWMYMAAYQLTRVKKEAQDSLKEDIGRIQQAFLTPGAESERWGLAARWAQFLTRGGD